MSKRFPHPSLVKPMPSSLLDREEYIEQAYFFRCFRERIDDNLSSQEVLANIGEEILATTKLPMAIDFLRAEMLQKGRISDGMLRLSHYFTSFQAFVMSRAEDEESRFDARIAFQVLEQEAEYQSGEPTPQGLFMFQFECISRNRLGYDRGLKAIADVPMFNEDWKTWIRRLNGLLGSQDFAELLYRRSEHHVAEVRRRTHRPEYEASYPILFDVQEGRIARANIGKDPLYMFAALQRQLGYPKVPRPAPPRTKPLFEPAIDIRFQQLESRVQLLEAEQKGGLDLTKYYKEPADFQSKTEDGSDLS
ncbi:MAG: hypothetical protein R3C02_22655 [Planctomycetaceae bacterium]